MLSKIIILFFIFIIIYNCGSSTVTVKKEEIPSFEKKYVILHLKNINLFLNNPKITNNQILGAASSDIPNFIDLYKTRQIHIYIDSIFVKPIGQLMITIPLYKIEKIEVNKLGFSDIISPVAIVAGIGSLLFFIVILSIKYWGWQN